MSDNMSETKRPAEVPTLPRTLYLETTNRCDSKCQTCVRTFLTLEPPKDLTLAELKGIVDQFPVLERVVLHGVGEPLLNRELFAMVTYVKARGATVLFNSDAIALTPTRARQLIESRLDEFRVSLWFTAMKANLDELPAFVRLAVNLGVPEVYVQRLVYNGQGLAVAEQSLHRALHEREQRLVEEATALARASGIGFQASGLTTPPARPQGTA